MLNATVSSTTTHRQEGIPTAAVYTFAKHARYDPMGLVCSIARSDRSLMLRVLVKLRRYHQHHLLAVAPRRDHAIIAITAMHVGMIAAKLQFFSLLAM